MRHRPTLPPVKNVAWHWTSAVGPFGAFLVEQNMFAADFQVVLNIMIVKKGCRLFVFRKTKIKRFEGPGGSSDYDFSVFYIVCLIC